MVRLVLSGIDGIPEFAGALSEIIREATLADLELPRPGRLCRLGRRTAAPLRPDPAAAIRLSGRSVPSRNLAAAAAVGARLGLGRIVAGGSCGRRNSAGRVPNAAEATNALADSFWNGLLDLSPITATMLGYEQGMDRLDDPGPRVETAPGHSFATRSLRRTPSRHRRPKRPACRWRERVTLDIVRSRVRDRAGAAGPALRSAQGRRPDGRPATMLPQLAAFQPTETPDQLEAFIARMADYPRFMAANAEVVREGLAGGLTAARIRDRARHRPAPAPASHSGTISRRSSKPSGCPSQLTATVSSTPSPSTFRPAERHFSMLCRAGT